MTIDDKNDSQGEEKRRTLRMSQEDASAYKEKRSRDDETSGEGGERTRRGGQGQRPAKPANVNLNLSPRMLDIAEALAEEAKMSVTTFLTEILKYVLTTQADQRGMNDRKFTSEFKNENAVKTTRWSPEPREKKKDFESPEEELEALEGLDTDEDREGAELEKPERKPRFKDNQDDRERGRAGGGGFGRGRSFGGGSGRGRAGGGGGFGGRGGAPAGPPRAANEIGWLKPGEQKTVTWQVRGTGTVTLEIASTRGGVDRRTLDVK